MCYDIKTSLEKQLRRAILDGNQLQIREINEKLSIFSPDQIELHHASGFSHPQMIIYTNKEPFKPQIATWGLVPFFAKTKEERSVIWNKTLNARGETMFKKNSFKYSAQNQRCLIYLEGFYEHQHIRNKKYPHFISLKNNELFAVAGLYTEFTDEEIGEIITTFSIVTTKANKEMKRIHNNPKLAEPRMPLILPEEIEDNWLIEMEDILDQKRLEEMVVPYPDNQLVSHTVKPIKGKNALGNVKAATSKYDYPELAAEQGSLF